MKIKIVVSMFLVWMTSGKAQEVTVKLNGGISGIQYKSTLGDGTIKLGGGAGVGYTYFLNDHWGVLTGVEAQYNSNTFELDNNQVISSYEIDDQTSAFEYKVGANGYKETQYFLSFAVPVMLQYRTPISNTTGIYLGLGGKVLIPAKQRLTATAETVSLSGYYPDLNLEIDDLPNHGFGTLNNWEEDASVSLKPALLVSMEGGLTFKLKEGMQLYTGIYADYGVSDLQHKDQNRNLLGYSPEGINNADAKGILSTTDVLDKSRYLSAGIQLKLGFVFGKDKPLPEEYSLANEVVVEERRPDPVVVEEKTPIKEVPKIPILSEEELTYVKAPLVFGTIDQTSLTPILEKRLDTIAEMVKGHEDIKLYITGYTCDLGSESLNKKIGMERAEAVAAYLKKQGVMEDHMYLDSKGEAEPLAPNTSYGNRVGNRRVSIQPMLVE